MREEKHEKAKNGAALSQLAVTEKATCIKLSEEKGA